jgi:hypothetical protein
MKKPAYILLTLLAISWTHVTNASPAGGGLAIRNAHDRSKLYPEDAKTSLLNHPQQQFSIHVRGGAGSMSISNGYTWYVRQCTEKPFVTKSITAAVISSLGDVMAQKLEAFSNKQDFVINPGRLASFFLCGLLYVGPFVHAWYEQLWKIGRWMEKEFGSSKPAQTIAALLADQTIGVFLFFPTYFYVYEFLEAAVSWRQPSFPNATAKCLEQIQMVFLMQYRIFPITNFISFAFVPEPLRVLWSNFISIFWNIYLCTMVAAKE